MPDVDWVIEETFTVQDGGVASSATTSLALSAAESARVSDQAIVTKNGAQQLELPTRATFITRPLTATIIDYSNVNPDAIERETGLEVDI